MGLWRSAWWSLFPKRAWNWVLGIWVAALLAYGMISTEFALFLVGFSFVLLLDPFLTILHETGHLLAGILVGFRIDFLQIGQLRWKKRRHGWHRETHPETVQISGLTAMYAVSTSRLRLRYAVFAAGGIVVDTALLALVLTAIPQTWDAMHGLLPDPAQGFWLGLEIAVAANLLFVMFYNLIPRMLGMQPNDAKVISSLIDNNALAHMLIANSQYTAQAFQGKRPAEISLSSMPDAIITKLPPHLYFQWHILNYLIAIDRKELPAAKQALNIAEAQLPSLPDTQKSNFLLILAWHQTVHESAKGAAQAALDQVPENLPGDWGLLGLMRAFALADEGKPALKQLDLAEQQLEDLLDRGTALLFLDSAKALRSRLSAGAYSPYCAKPAITARISSAER